MHLVIISAAARPCNKSNTAKIISAFQKGFEQNGNTAEVYYLSERSKWENAKDAFCNNKKILFAIPLYVENVPGIMLEFLSQIAPKNQNDTELYFLVQGGFPEASQARCCEAYLKILAGELNCQYCATIIKGDMFGLSMLDEKSIEKKLAVFREIGKEFAKNEGISQSQADLFLDEEYMSDREVKMYNLFGNKVSKLFMRFISKKLGNTKPLDDKPYQNYLLQKYNH